MVALAYTPEAIELAVVAILTPGGVPVGTVGKVTNAEIDGAYGVAPGEGLPVVRVRAIQTRTEWAAALAVSGTSAIDLIYLDSLPSAQDGQTPESVRQIMVANRNAIVAALLAHRTLDGAVTKMVMPIEEVVNPNGWYFEWAGAQWYGFTLRTAYQGPKQPVPTILGQ